LTVIAAASCSPGSYQWAIEAKQSNNFNGPPGNDLQLDPASAGNLSGSVNGACSLAFTGDGQPALTAAGATITSAAGSGGGPVKVQVLSTSGQLDTASTAAITVAIGPGSSPGTLSGTLTVNAVAGIASFSDLSINQAGDFTLVATSPGISPVTSNGFTIGGSVQQCPTSTCTVTSSANTTSATVTATSPSPGQFLSVGIGGVSYSCAGTYQPVSAPVSFDVYDSSGAQQSAQFTVTMDIDKSLVQSSGRTGASQWQVCYASVQPFTAESGTAMIGGVLFHTGLLPACSSTVGQPCVQSLHKDMAGDEIITFLASGDPVGRG
jgi:hypothetical protein